MPISRRDFFVRLIHKTADEVPKIIPKKIQPFLGIEPEMMSAEQAGQQISRLKRKKIPAHIQSPELSHAPITTNPPNNGIDESKGTLEPVL